MRVFSQLISAGTILLFLALVDPCLAATTNNQVTVLSKAGPGHLVVKEQSELALAGKYIPRYASLSELAYSDRMAILSPPQGKNPHGKVVPVSMIQNQTFGDPPFIIQATSNSPGTITYSLISGKATVTPTGLVTLTGIGSVTVGAMQAATNQFTGATQTATFAVFPGTPAITFNVTNATASVPFMVSASSASTGAFSYSVVSGPAKITGNMVTLSGTGQVVLKASQAADANFSPGSKTAAVMFGAPTLTVTANNASRLYGAQNPSFSGAVTGSSQGDTFVESFSTVATTASAPGSYLVVPAASGPDLKNYTVDAVSGTLTIAQAPALTTLSSSSTTINPGHALSLTAQVTSTTSGVPSGSVTFFDNGAPLQTVVLANGSALLTTSLSPGTTHVLTATSSGDANFLASAQSSALNVAANSADFAFRNQGSTTVSSAPGSMATYTFRISPVFGSFGAPVTFSVVGLPNSASAVFTPSKIASNAGASTVQLFIQTATQTVRQNQRSSHPSNRGVVVATVFLLAFTGSGRLRQRLAGRVLAVALIGLGFSGTVVLSGCGSGILEQGSGSYSLSVVATSGTIQHTQDVTLTMQ